MPQEETLQESSHSCQKDRLYMWGFKKIFKPEIIAITRMNSTDPKLQYFITAL
jgi:hypothetical protein